MIRFARCGAVGSDQPFQLTYIHDASSGATPELYPSQIGFRFGIATWSVQPPNVVRGMRTSFALGNSFGRVILSEEFTINPRVDGFCDIRAVTIGVPILTELYMSFAWTTCQNAPPYSLSLVYRGSPFFNVPVGMTYVLNLTPLLDRVTACSG